MRGQFAVAVACALMGTLCGPLYAAVDTVPGPGKLHLEACTKWTEQNNSFGVKNECGEPVALLFIQLNGQHRLERLVNPNERFDTGLSEKTLKSTGWLFTACPAGHVPTVPFTVENKDPLLKGQYQCVRK